MTTQTTALKITVKEYTTLFNPTEVIRCSIIDDNTFPNPKYIQNETYGYSNHQTPEFITSYQNSSEKICTPRGYLQQLISMLEEEERTAFIEDQRIENPKSFPALNATLRGYQERAVCKALRHNEGVIVSPTGSGKTLMGLEIMRRRCQKSLIIVHRNDLAKQWISVLKERMGIDAGLIGDGKYQIGEMVTIGMIQTLSSIENLPSEEFGLILVDECHHIPAQIFTKTLSQFSAKFLYGLSATLGRRDGLEQLIYRGIGPVIANVEREEVEDMGNIVPVVVYSVKTGFDPGSLSTWNDYLASLTECQERNTLIIDIAKKTSSSSTSSVLILCDRIEHCKRLSALCTESGIEHVIAHGSLKGTDREAAMSDMRSASITIGTTGLLGEGLDVSTWSSLIMATPISSEIKLMQAIGRIVRPCEGKNSAMVYDLKDDCAFAGSSFKNRFEIYKKHNIWVNF